MAFEFLKKGKAALSDFGGQVRNALSGKGGPKAGLRNKSFEEGAKSLTPVENMSQPKGGAKKEGLKTSGDAPNEGETFKNKTATDQMWRNVDDKLSAWGIAGLIENAHGIFLEYLTREFNQENLHAYDALRDGMDPKEFFEKFLKPGAEMEVNVNTATYAEALKTNDFSKIDFAAIEHQLVLNLSDPHARALFDDTFMTSLFQQLNQVTPPKKAHGYYE